MPMNESPEEKVCPALWKSVDFYFRGEFLP